MAIGHAVTITPPPALQGDYRRAIRMEWITVVYLISVAVVMYLASGNSQAMEAAWIEDVVSIFPAVAFLLASKIHQKPATDRFPYGFQKAFTVAFVGAAIALLVLGLYALVTSFAALIKAEHPSIGTFTLFGKEYWLGWLMLAALLYSCIPAIILGRLKLPLAKRLHEKVLFVDSHAQKADWLTAAGGMVGVIGIGFGIWWLDAVVAIAISSSIVYDGITRTRDSMKDLLEEIPTTTDNKKIHPLVEEVVSACLRCDWVSDVRVRLRESGMVFVGDVLVIPKHHDNLIHNTTNLREQLVALDWKISDIVISPVSNFAQLHGDGNQRQEAKKKG
jgi:cation diffusion facilitator family transporter